MGLPKLTYKQGQSLICIDWKVRGHYKQYRLLKCLKKLQWIWSTCVPVVTVGHTEVRRIYRDIPGHRKLDNMPSAQTGMTGTDSSYSALETHRWNEPERWTQVWRQQCSPFLGNFPKNENEVLSFILLTFIATYLQQKHI